jgi:hypothetical protein
MQELRTVWERTAQEVAVPIVVDHTAVAVVHKVAAEVAQTAHSMVGVAVPIVVVHKAVEAVQVARMAAVVVGSDLAAAVGLDHKTWIIPPIRYIVITERRIPRANLNFFSQSYFPSLMVPRTDYSRNL